MLAPKGLARPAQRPIVVVMVEATVAVGEEAVVLAAAAEVDTKKKAFIIC